MAKRNLAHTCKGMKKDGKPCLMPPLAGSEYCRHHLSASNQKSDEDREVSEHVRKRERDVARVIARIGEEAFQQAAERFHLMELECMWLMEAVTKKGIPEHVFYEVLDRHPKFEEHVEWIVETSGEKKLGSFVETFMMWRNQILYDELKPRSVYSAAFWASRHNYESAALLTWLEKRKWQHGPEGDEYPSFQTWLDEYHAWLNTEGKESQAATPALSDVEAAQFDESDSFLKHLFAMAGVEATGAPMSIRKAITSGTTRNTTAGSPISKGELVTQGKDGKVYGTGYVAPPAALADIESGEIPPFFRPIILSFRQPRPLFEEIFMQGFGLDGSYQQAMPFNPSMDNLVVHVFAGEIVTNEETGKKEYRSTGSEPDFTVGLPTTFFPHDDAETGKGLKCLINGKFFALNADGWNGTAEDDPYVIATKRNAWMGLQWPVDATPAKGNDQSGGMPSPGPLAEEDTKARTMLQNPGIATIFGACVVDKAEGFQPFSDGERGGLRFKAKGGNALALYNHDEVPIDLRTAAIESEAFEIWARTGVIGDLSLLDDTAWDIAALGVTAFFARTEGADIDKPFPLLFEDYYDWRSTDPRKRSETMNREIQQRIELLSDTKRARIFTRGKLYLPDPKTKRNILTDVVTEGSFFSSAAKFWRTGQLRLIFSESDRVPDGYLLRLGEWAREYVKAKAMLGVNIKRLAEYNLRRELWERRIGWYLVFQLQNQASKTTSTTRTGKDGKTREIVKPQHPLLSQTILDGAGIDWKRMAKTNPGKVIGQFVKALDTLKADGIISQYQCLDGTPDGESLPVYGRLTTWLQWRWAFLPGTVQADFLRPKREAAEKAKASAATRHDAAQRLREKKGPARGG